MNGKNLFTMNEFRQSAQHPFVAKIVEFPLSTKFKVPTIEVYDGRKIPSVESVFGMV